MFFSGVSLESGLSGPTVALALVAFVVLFAYLKRRDGDEESLLPKVARAALAIAGILMFAISRSNGAFPVLGSLLGGVLLVAIALFGIFVMFSRKPKRRRRR